MIRFFLLPLLVLLSAGAAAGDPDEQIEQARQRCLTHLAGTYRIQGYRDVQHLPRKKPDYEGTLTVRRRGDHFELEFSWPHGGARGLGMLDSGRLVANNTILQLVVSTQSKEGNLGVTLYQVEPPFRSGDPWTLSGPWITAKNRGYERVIQTSPAPPGSPGL